ncbi:MAG: hypothetical protein SF051_08465, partial [Elusimicrobiota bacterium]|nr:hypothetical protein [Elusimicrobiota bacterium]
EGPAVVSAANAALAAARAPLAWLLPAGAEADPLVERTLAEGLAARPYAGGAAPRTDPGAISGDPVRRAVWTLHRKGDWREDDHRSPLPGVMLRLDALDAAGRLDERFDTLHAALLDLSLRLRLAGRPLFRARDAMVPNPALAAPTLADRDLLTDKWSVGALRLLESLAVAQEPPGYRLDAGVRAGLRGER